ncbi:MAG: hypothetical protein RTV72_15740 [Candidatus Thorarchaeota archaeon]
MTRNRIAIAISLLVLFAALNLSTIQEVASDPVLLPYLLETGSHMILGESVSMPEALVNISVVPTRLGEEEFRFEVDIKGIYTIESLVSQNTSIGFAFPEEWQLDTFALDIILDGEAKQYENISFNDLPVENEQILSEWEWLDDHVIAAFNATLQEAVVSELKVRARYNISRLYGDFTFRYTVGTASSWSGPTEQTVTIYLKNAEEFIDVAFTPFNGLVLTSAGSWSVATWEMTLTSLSIHTVGFTCTIINPSLPFWVKLLAIPAAIFVVILLVAIWMKRR